MEESEREDTVHNMRMEESRDQESRKDPRHEK